MKENQMSNFTLADIRAQRTKDVSAMTKALEKSVGGDRGDKNEGFFQLERDKAGNGTAVLRFLPTHPDDELPWVTTYTHAFQGPTGKWYIEASRTTIGEPDPLSEKNRALWATGRDEDKELARKQKRKEQKIANVLVVSYPAHPELEGQVLHYKFGKKIFEKILDKAKPTFADETPVDVFNPFTGANFKLRVRMVDGYPNYDTSVFDAPKAISDDEEEVLEILNKIKPLKTFVDPSKFKSYDQLAKKYDEVMNAKPAATRTVDDFEEMTKVATKASAPTPKAAAAPAAAPKADDDEDIESFFASVSR